MSCPQALRVQAYFDGEVDAPNVAAIEEHLAGCTPCRGWLSDLTQARERLREEWRTQSAPPALRQRIDAALEREESHATLAQRQAKSQSGPVWRTRAFWLGAGSALTGLAAASALALLFWLPGANESLLADLSADHQRSLLPGKLIAVESSNHHTVKPWFAGRADVSPVVADFAGQEFVLLGGRVDQIAQQRAAVLVYRHRLHVINVFAWKADSLHLPRDTIREGFHLVFWQAGDLRYCAMSDAAWAELRELKRLLVEVERRDREG